jgi:hypothetical protein
MNMRCHVAMPWAVAIFSVFPILAQAATAASTNTTSGAPVITSPVTASTSLTSNAATGAAGPQGASGAGALRVLDANNQVVGTMVSTLDVAIPFTLDGVTIMFDFAFSKTQIGPRSGESLQYLYTTIDCTGLAYTYAGEAVYSDKLARSAAHFNQTYYFYPPTAMFTFTFLAVKNIGARGAESCSPVQAGGYTTSASTEDYIAKPDTLGFTAPFRLAP